MVAAVNGNGNLSRKEARRMRGGRWDQSNTVLLDDSAVKASAQPFNVVEVPEFVGNEDEELRLLRRVANYLAELRWWSDVSAFMRSNPFRVDDARWDVDGDCSE